MSLQFDHAVVAVLDLNSAIRDYRELGFTVVLGGIHANRATQNALITFSDGTYLELLASTEEQALPGLIDFSVLLRNGEGLVGFALRSGDLEAESARLQALGFSVGAVLPGERRRQDGTLIQWKLALLDDGFAPFFIQDVTPRNLRITDDPALVTHPNRAMGLRGIEIAVRSMTPAWERYTRLFGISPHPQAVYYRTVESVALNEGRDAGLSALHLLTESNAVDRFTLERTHRVRFRRVGF